MLDSRYLAALYFITCISCVAVFFGKHQWGWIVAAGVWLALGIYSFIRYNKDGNDLDK